MNVNNRGLLLLDFNPQPCVPMSTKTLTFFAKGHYGKSNNKLQRKKNIVTNSNVCHVQCTCYIKQSVYEGKRSMLLLLGLTLFVFRIGKRLYCTTQLFNGQVPQTGDLISSERKKAHHVHQQSNGPLWTNETQTKLRRRINTPCPLAFEACISVDKMS
ncbi:unnamed protein product [Arctogadus glacialis]